MFVEIRDGSCEIDVELSDVELFKVDIDSLLPTQNRLVDGRIASGKNRSDDWMPWTAELAAAIYDGSIMPDTTITAATNVINDRLNRLGHKVFSDETVRRTLGETLRRIKRE